MMINKSHDIDATEESFRAHLKKQAFLMSFYILFGAAMLVWMNLGNGSSVLSGDHAHGFFLSFSGAIFIIGVIKLIQIIRCMKNPERFQKAYTEYTDERNRFVLMKSYYYSSYIFILLMAVAVIAVNALGLSPVISTTLASCIGVFALILTATYRIMNRIH